MRPAFVVVAMVGALCVSTAGAGDLPYAPEHCTAPRIRPVEIALTCGHGPAFLDGRRLRWSAWTATSARGHGTATYETAGIKPRHYRIRVRLRRVRSTACGGSSVPLFRRAVLRFPRRHPPGGSIQREVVRCIDAP